MVEDFNRAVNDGTDEYFEGLDEEIEFIPLTALLDGVTYRGKDRVRRWMDDLRRDWEIYEITIEEVRDLNEDHVLAIGSWHARGRRSGVELRLQQAAWLAHYRNERFSGGRPSPTGQKPSKPPGCRSRRCRRRTWR